MDDKTIDVAPEQIQTLAIRQGTAMAVDRPPNEVLAEARNAAQALHSVISTKKKKVMMNGEQYLEFEDWQTLGHFYGVTAGEDGDPEPVIIGDVKGFKASAVAYRHGQVISRATQYCMSDESNWSHKPLFQLSSMAQTRANAKVLRNVLAWVVVLAGYRPTPAEELETQTTVQIEKPDNLELAEGEEFGVIEKLSDEKMGGSKKDKPFRVFTFNGKSIFCWDTKVHPFLVSHAGKAVIITAESRNKFINLVSVREVATATIDEEPPLEENPF